ncbi:TetR/AcrR family transcriptional regulator [Massilia sp. CMS3.1]|uniref:TetR/AcrR family transcriptional regulator n=1 Tax=Massilia sp. CMS3.1 TaxID=3373083 RepID=UPI003EE42735
MSKKLPRAERRAQLLATAQAIVRTQGTDALSLGELARQAGVSKPIAYNHFETRAGLMIALYKELNTERVRFVGTMLDHTPARLADRARVISEAYMECHAAMGPEWQAIGAALKGDAEMDACHRVMIEEYIDFFHGALGPFSPLHGDDVRRRCIGIVGAAEALSDAAVRGLADQDMAAADLAALIDAWLAA